MPSSTSRPCVVLVHGFPGGSADFGLLVAGDRTFDELWVQAQAARLEGVLAGAGEVVLVGHDIGGPIALAVADRLGSRVRGLVVASCNLLRDPPLPGPFGLLSAPLLGPLVESVAFSRASRAAMGRFGRRGGLLPRPNTSAEARAIRTIVGAGP
jgi:pimeloyl-ACP methyl ester carboxylesterase